MLPGAQSRETQLGPGAALAFPCESLWLPSSLTALLLDLSFLKSSSSCLVPGRPLLSILCDGLRQAESRKRNKGRELFSTIPKNHGQGHWDKEQS